MQLTKILLAATIFIATPSNAADSKKNPKDFPLNPLTLSSAKSLERLFFDLVNKTPAKSTPTRNRLITTLVQGLPKTVGELAKHGIIKKFKK